MCALAIYALEPMTKALRKGKPCLLVLLVGPIAQGQISRAQESIPTQNKYVFDPDLKNTQKHTRANTVTHTETHWHTLTHTLTHTETLAHTDTLTHTHSPSPSGGPHLHGALLGAGVQFEVVDADGGDHVALAARVAGAVREDDLVVALARAQHAQVLTEGKNEGERERRRKRVL